MHYSNTIAPLNSPSPSELDVIAGISGTFNTTNLRCSSASSTYTTSPLTGGARKGSAGSLSLVGAARKGSAGSLSLVGADLVHPIAGVYGAPVTESPRNSVLGEGNLRKLTVQSNMSFVNVCLAFPLSYPKLTLWQVGRPTLRTQTMESTSTSVSRRDSDFMDDEVAAPKLTRTSETAGVAQDPEAASVGPSYSYLAAPSSSQDMSPVLEEKEVDRQPNLEVAAIALQNTFDSEEHADACPPTPVQRESKRRKSLQRFKRFMLKVVKFVTKRRRMPPVRGKGKRKSRM